MHTIKYKLENETVEAQQAAGRYNPARVCIFRVGTKTIRPTIGAGTSDIVRVYSHQGFGVVFVINRRLDYCGIEVYNAEGREVGQGFCQGSERVTEYVGPKGLDLEDYTLATRLFAHMDL